MEMQFSARSCLLHLNTARSGPLIGALLMLIGGLATAPCAPHAADWSATNVQLLRGSNYADDFGIDDKKKTLLTMEHASGWKYGDNFFFMDVPHPTAAGTSHYGEFAPRFSLGKLMGTSLKFGVVKDVLIAGNWELGDGVRSVLYGPGLAFDIPGFAFFDFNFYARKSYRDFVTDQTERGYQATIDWLVPFTLGSAKFAFEGFADYAFGEDGGSSPKEDNLIAAPRFLVDVGSFGGAPGVLQVGIEYQIWRNKFGIDGVDEDVVQAMLKWTL